MKRDPRYFKANKHHLICSEHFERGDFHDYDCVKSERRFLKDGAIPTIFEWTKDSAHEAGSSSKQSAVEKLNQSRVEKEELLFISFSSN